MKAPKLSDRVYNKLIGRIEKMKPGQSLPSARKLAGEFSTSSSLVTQQISRLAEAGLLDTRRGRPAVVKEIDPTLTIGFGAVYADLDVAPINVVKGRIISVFGREDPAFARASKELSLTASTPMVLVERIRAIRDKRIRYEKAYLPARLVGADLFSEQLTDPERRFSLVHYMRERGVHNARTTVKVVPRLATTDECKVLGLANNEPVLVVRQVSYAVVEGELHPYEYLETVTPPGFEVSYVRASNRAPIFYEAEDSDRTEEGSWLTHKEHPHDRPETINGAQERIILTSVAKHLALCLKLDKDTLLDPLGEMTRVRSPGGIVNVAGSVSKDYELYQVKNDPATEDIAVTLIIGAPFADHHLARLDELSTKLDRIIKRSSKKGAHFSPYPISNVHITVSSLVRTPFVLDSVDRRQAQIKAIKTSQLDLDKVTREVSSTRRFHLQLRPKRLRIGNRGEVLLEDQANGEGGYQLEGLRERLRDRLGYLRAKGKAIHSCLGTIKGFHLLEREHKQIIAREVEALLTNFSPLTERMAIDTMRIVLYKHRSLAKVASIEDRRVWGIHWPRQNPIVVQLEGGDDKNR